MRARISPCWPADTASGLIIANVRSRATKVPPSIDSEHYNPFESLNGGLAETAFVHAFKDAATVEPRSAGDSTVRIPAAFIATYFIFAVPCPPLIIAPA